MNTGALRWLFTVAAVALAGSVCLAEGRNYVPNGDFEVGYGHGLGYAQQSRNYTLFTTWDTKVAHHGKASMKIPDWSILVTRAIPVRPGKTYTLSLWVKPVTAGSPLKVSVYNGDKKQVPTTGRSPATVLDLDTRDLKEGWQQIKISGEFSDFPTADYHIRLTTGNSAVWIDELQLEEGSLTDFKAKSPVEIGLVCDKASNIFIDGEKVAMPLLVNNDGKEAFSGKVNYEVYDFLNRKVKTGSVDARVPAGETWQGSMDLDTGKRGIFRTVIWVDGQDGTEDEVVYSVVPKPRVEGADPTSMMGIHASASPHVYAAMHKLGIKWQRSLSPTRWMRWSVVEPEKGKFVWADAEVRQAVDAKMEILGCIHGWAPWALSPYAEGSAIPAGKVEITDGKRGPRCLLDLDAWEAYVFAVVDHYKNEVHTWEICNEPIWDMKAAPYVEILKRATRAIRKADPKAKIVGMGGSYELTWQLEVFKGLGDKPKDFMDMAATHLYPPGSDPFNPSHDARGLDYHEKMIVPFDIEVWNTETGPWCGGIYQGPNSNYRCLDEKTGDGYMSSDVFFRGFNYEADRTVYNFMHTMGNGMTRFFYYDARLFGGPDYYKTHCTILHYDDTIRTKGVAYAVLGWLFDHSKGLGNLATDPKTKMAQSTQPGARPGAAGEIADELGPDASVYAYMFDRGGVPVVAIWASDMKNRTLALGLSAEQFKAYDMMGNEMKLTGATVPFGRTPVYLEGQGKLAVEQMKAAVQKGKLAEVADKTPPNLSISECPRGQIADSSIRVRWIAADDTSVPRVGGKGDPKAVTYSFRLVGRDKDWSEWAPKTVVFYKDLTPGKYSLEVKAKDAAGNISETAVREFSVKPK